MTWTFHTADRSEENRRGRVEEVESQVKHLEHLEAMLVRRLVTLRERRAFYPNEVSARQVTELDAKLEELRARIDTLRTEVPARPEE
jgi:archaellum component FlaC